MEGYIEQKEHTNENCDQNFSLLKLISSFFNRDFVHNLPHRLSVLKSNHINYNEPLKDL